MLKRGSDPFDFAYKSKPSDFPELGDLYKPPAVFNPFESYPVATLEGSGDGGPVTVYESRCPANFYEVVAEPRFVGGPGFVVSTGSGPDMRKLAADLARALASGMINIESIGGDK